MAIVSMYVAEVSGPRNRNLQVKLGKLKSPEPLEKLGRHIATRMEAGAPVQSSLLRDTIRDTVTPVSRGPGGSWLVGVGPYSEMGDPRREAPRGTIKEFLQDYPQYYERGWKRKVGWPPSQAWWILPYEGKRQLDWSRSAGMYGGAVDGKVIPAYWYLQEAGHYPSINHPIPKMFVSNALDSIADAAKQIYSFMET